MKTKSKHNRVLTALSVVAVMVFSVFLLTACGHEHKFSADWSYDETHHWHAPICEHEKEKEDYAEHEIENNVCQTCGYGAIATINSTYYHTLADAVDSITDDTVTTIKLLGNYTGSGVVVSAGQNIIFDLNNFTYFLEEPMVGSSGTQTNGFQLLKGSTVTFKNGTLKQTQNGFKICIQNYSDLTLQNVTLDGRYENANNVCQFVLSNCFGNITLKGNTNIYAPEDKTAFDVYYWYNGTYNDGVYLTIDESFTGSVGGKIVYNSSNNAPADWETKCKLEIKGGNFDATEFGITNTSNANIVISGGTFAFDVSAYLADGYTCTQNGTNWIVSAE